MMLVSIQICGKWLTNGHKNHPECGKTRSVIFLLTKTRILLARSRRGCCKKIKNKTWQTLGFGAYAGNEGMGGQRRSNTQKTHNALYF